VFARERGIPVGELSQKGFASAEERDVAMRDFLRDHEVELVVDAGYDRVHSHAFLEAFEDRIINVHPSLLPEFGGGMDAVEQALASEAKMTGATVHIVTASLDAGPILVQEAVPILEGDTVDTLRERVHAAEHRILPQAIHLMEARIAAGRAQGANPIRRARRAQIQ
jgi:phosphoribosylglycinamide formyltransferase 1